jgi:hypothetical protein
VRFAITAVGLALFFTLIVADQSTLAQRPPVAPPGGNPGKQPTNPARPGPIGPAKPNQGGKQGIVGTGRPVTPGQRGAPQFETVWRCSNCNEELGNGPDKPNLATCPKCGVSFDPDYAPTNPTNKNTSYPAFNSAPTFVLFAFACIGFLVAVVVIVVLIKCVLG